MAALAESLPPSPRSEDKLLPPMALGAVKKSASSACVGRTTGPIDDIGPPIAPPPPMATKPPPPPLRLAAQTAGDIGPPPAVSPVPQDIDEDDIPPPPPPSMVLEMPAPLTLVADEDKDVPLPQMPAVMDVAPPKAVLTGDQKKLQRRAKVASEIYTTEEAYVKQLSLVVTVFMEPIKVIKGLTQNNVMDLFSNIETILTLHKKLLEDIDERVSDWGPKTVLGDVFQGASKWIKLYKHYINNYDHAIVLLETLKEKNSEFRKFVERLDYSEQVAGLSFQSYLVVPVQRIPRYLLLLRELATSTPDGHPDNALLEEALTSIKELADYINEKKRVSENQTKLVDIKKKWKGFRDDLLSNPERIYLRDFVVSFARGNVRLWLFNDIAVVTSSETSLTGKYVFKFMFALHATAIQREKEENSFKLFGTDHTLTGSVKTEDLICLEEAVEKAHNTMIQSVFRRTVVVDPREVSQQFLRFKEEEYRERRRKALQNIITTEREYICFLDFYRQMYTHLSSVGFPVTKAVHLVFVEAAQFASSFHFLHWELFQKLEARLRSWGPQHDTISDIFLELLPKLVYYQQFSENCKIYREHFERAKRVKQFSEWVQTQEGAANFSIIPSSEKMLARIVAYYMSIHETLQNTHKQSADFEEITRVAASIDSLKSALVEKAR